jgi:hypothetical protein
MRFARWVFLLSGVSGILLVTPPYFLERQTGEDYAPPVTHPEYYYGFLGVTLAWAPAATPSHIVARADRRVPGATR